MVGVIQKEIAIAINQKAVRINIKFHALIPFNVDRSELFIVPIIDDVPVEVVRQILENRVDLRIGKLGQPVGRLAPLKLS